MGTRVEYSINLLSATSVESNKNKLSVKGVDVWENHHQNKYLISSENPHRFGIGTNYYLQFPMERRMLDRNIMESIKRTMQMHEEIFKHQVGELHRVYSVQKMLMDELKKEHIQKKMCTPMNNKGKGIISQPDHKTTQTTHGTAADSQAPSLRVDDMCSKERSSGSCSGENKVMTKMPTSFNLEIPDEGEARPCGPSSSHTAFAFQRGIDEEMEEVDLTLSIGGGGGSNRVKKKNKTKTDHNVGELGLMSEYSKLNLLCDSFKSDIRAGECSDPNTPNMSSSSVTFEQERKEPTQFWLSQGLKLK